MTALILQARLDSVRLPGKSLLPISGRPLIFRVMEALSRIKCDAKILACPEDCAPVLVPLAEEAGFAVVVGPKDDVLARFCNAVRQTKADRIIRATGDNPFVMTDAAQTLNDETIAAGADYGLYLQIPHGSGVECVSAEALLKAEKESKSEFEREHVCPFLYNNPSIYRLYRPDAPSKWRGAELNVTVDTLEDYNRAQKLYDALSVVPEGERHNGETIIAHCRKINGEQDG